MRKKVSKAVKEGLRDLKAWRSVPLRGYARKRFMSPDTVKLAERRLKSFNRDDSLSTSEVLEWNKKRRVSTPGEIMVAHYMKPFRLSKNDVSKSLQITIPHVTGLIDGSRRVSKSLAKRLAKLFLTTPALWLNLQKSYDKGSV